MCLFVITLDTLVIGIGQIILNDKVGEYCSYPLNVIYGISSMNLFYLASVIGFKFNGFLFDIHEFVKFGSLPSKKLEKIRLIVAITITIVMVLLVLAYMISGAFFIVFFDENYHKLWILNFWAIWALVLMQISMVIIFSFAIYRSKNLKT